MADSKLHGSLEGPVDFLGTPDFPEDMQDALERRAATRKAMSEGSMLVAEIREGNRQRYIALGEPGVQAQALLEAHDPNHIPYVDSD